MRLGGHETCGLGMRLGGHEMCGLGMRLGRHEMCGLGMRLGKVREVMNCYAVFRQSAVERHCMYVTGWQLN